MSRFITYVEILDGKVDEKRGIAEVGGSSLTIPGQGSDLSQIISSIVKLPPIDERTFDVKSGEKPDFDRLAVETDLDGLYMAEGVNLAEDAKARLDASQTSKKENESEKDEESSDENDES